MFSHFDVLVIYLHENFELGGKVIGIIIFEKNEQLSLLIPRLSIDVDVMVLHTSVLSVVLFDEFDELSVCYFYFFA